MGFRVPVCGVFPCLRGGCQGATTWGAAACMQPAQAHFGPPPRMVFMRAVHPQSQQFAVCRGKHPPAATLRCAVLPQAAEQLDEEVLKQEAVEATDAGVEDLMAQLAGLTS